MERRRVKMSKHSPKIATGPRPGDILKERRSMRTEILGSVTVFGDPVWIIE